MATGATRLDGDHAHHIVAAEHPLAAPARKVLAAVGMSINDPHNGMFLRAAFHQGMHTNAYYIAVNAALRGASTYKDVSMRLFDISVAIYTGTFPR